MKQHILTALAVAAILTACNSDDMHEADATSTTTITFSMTGDFQLTAHDFTRSLEADGKTMTDVWVLDYVGGELKQQLHQTSDDADFGSPTMGLSLGTHHIYFIASRGAGASLNTTTHALTFTSVRDTFWKDYEITISGGTSAGSRAVALDRIVSKLKVVFSDAIPAGAATFNVTPASWCYGFNYMTGEPTTASSSQAITINIPVSEIGVVNEAISIFGFSSANEWTTNVSIDCKDSDNGILGSAVISGAPFVRNRISEYTGPLFGDNGAMNMSLNADWINGVSGTW